MTARFKRIALFGRQRVLSSGVSDTLSELFACLQKLPVTVLLEEQSANVIDDHQCQTVKLSELQKAQVDLLIVVGGDGSLLNAARSAARQGIPVTGINRGRLGFLTDILPAELEEQVTAIINGQFQSESRFLLQADVYYDGEHQATADALNDVVLLPGNVAHMIEFDILVDKKAVCHQRADGLIVATPTGSTAYALSGGGPILHPSLSAVALVPMFPHTLSSRPIVVSADAEIELVINANNDISPFVSCDGQDKLTLQPGSKVHIHKKQQLLTLLHPKQYDYYHTLRTKLGWQKK